MMRPYVIINAAMSADGKISTRERRQVKISGKDDFARVDRLKAGCDGIMVGIGTVLADDPSLTVKSDENKRSRTDRGMDEHPVRIVVDSRARTPLAASILHKGPGKRVIAVSERAGKTAVAGLGQHAEVIVCGTDDIDLGLLLDKLGAMGIRRLMVEGGGTLIAGFFAAGLVDELYTYIGNLIIGGADAPTLADGPGRTAEIDFSHLALVGSQPMDSGILLHWKVVRR